MNAAAGPAAGPTAGTGPHLAATVVLLRPGPDGAELVLTHRPATMAFAAGLHVFPGGRVDPGDGDPRLAARTTISPESAAAALGGNLPPAEALAVHHAAIRELFEEAGVLLADGAFRPAALHAARAGLLAGTVDLAAVAEELGATLRPDVLAPLGHWTTPPVMPRRFSTWFFAADLPEGAEPSFDTEEIVAELWTTPAAALERLASGEIAMWIPTSATVQHLARIADDGDSAPPSLTAARVREAIRFEREAPPAVIEDGPDVARLMLSGAGGVPGRAVVTTLVGRRQIVVVDPGDPAEAASAAIGNAATRRGGLIAAIVLTDPSPDVAAGAEGLALTLDIPNLAAAAASRVLPFEVRAVADGDRLPSDVPAIVRLDPVDPARLTIVAQDPPGIARLIGALSSMEDVAPSAGE
jgi:8-oxo-dGTP pyrophosphatase MutT (NUDIX family)